MTTHTHSDQLIRNSLVNGFAQLARVIPLGPDQELWLKICPVNPFAPTHLEERVELVNEQAACKRSYLAMWGRIQHLIRWKIEEQKKRFVTRVVFSDLESHAMMCKFDAFLSKADQSCILATLLEKLKDIELRRECLSNLASGYSFSEVKPLDFGILKYAMEYLELGPLPAEDIVEFARKLKNHVIRYIESVLDNGITINGKKYAISLEQLRGWATEHKDLLIVIFRESLRRKHLTFAKLLKHLETAAYRAHLSRRVKPAQRRARAPRPLYARPRPPTAPLAPPVI